MELAKNILLALLSFGFPIFLVLRIRGWRGIALGALSLWVLIFVSSEIGFADRPEDRGIGSGMWVVTGWLVGLMYGLAVRGVQFVLRFRK